MDGADLQSLYECSKRLGLPMNDVNCALYHERMNLINAFRKRVRLLKIRFEVSSYTEADLHEWNLESSLHDRIDVTNLYQPSNTVHCQSVVCHPSC